MKLPSLLQQWQAVTVLPPNLCIQADMDSLQHRQQIKYSRANPLLHTAHMLPGNVTEVWH